jgi:hypothetical protein
MQDEYLDRLHADDFIQQAIDEANRMAEMQTQHEDELPEDITDAEYDEWWEKSYVDNGVRIGPVFHRSPKDAAQHEE